MSRHFSTAPSAQVIDYVDRRMIIDPSSKHCPMPWTGENRDVLIAFTTKGLCSATPMIIRELATCGFSIPLPSGAMCVDGNPNREKLKVPPRPFPLEELSHYNHSGQLQVFFTQLEPNVHGVRQSSHVSVETNSNKRISVLGTNHTKIYRVNLVGFKHSAEDPSRSPQKQNKYTLRSKRFSNVLTNHQGRFPTTLKPFPKQNNSLTEVLLTSD